MKKIIFSAAVLTAVMANAQNSGIGTTKPDASAQLEVNATNKGLLIPRLSLSSTTVAAPVTAPATGLTVFNTATAGDVTPGYYYWDGAKWAKQISSNDNALISSQEPWRVFNEVNLTNTPATTNTQDIYQTGNVQIASSKDRQIGQYGNRLYFGGWDDQTDNMFITRYNEKMDQSAIRFILGNNGVNGETTISTDGNKISDFFSVGAWGNGGLYEENFRLNSGTGESIFGNQNIAEGTISLRPNLSGSTSAKIVYSDAGNSTDLAISKNVGGTEKDLMIVRQNGDVNVKGSYLYVDGSGYEGNPQSVYIGADTANNDVEVGTLSPTVTSIALFNRSTADFLNAGMRDAIIRNDLFVANNTNLQNVGNGATTDDILVRSTDGLVKKVAASSLLGGAQNLYNADGAVLENRTVSQNGKSVTFAGGDFNAAYSNFANGIIELTKNSTGDRNSFIDFHAAGAPGVGDYEARIIRTAGTNGTFEISNTGTAPIKLWNVVNVTEKLGIGTDTPTARLHIIGNEPALAQFESSVSDAAIRIIPNHNMNGRFAIKTNDDNKDTEFLGFNNGNAATAIVIKHETGNVGIGQLNPQSKFEVAGIGGIANLAGINLDPAATSNISTILGNYTNSSKMLVGWNRSAGDGEIDLISNRGNGAGANGGGFGFYDLTTDNNLNALLRIKGDGSTGIGTNNPTQKLEVAGNVKANQFIAGTQTFPDYVFQNYYTGTASKLNPSYKFTSLNETEKFIKENGHLPGFESAAEVVKKGEFNVSDTSLKSVEKIEELYLHMIELEKRVQQLEKENQQLKANK